MKIGALQTAYLPWLGFFDQIWQCDRFVIYDDLQYTKKDWRNRNRIKTSHGPIWLTVPVAGRGAHQKRICDMEISRQNKDWRRQHWQTIQMNYAQTLFFPRYGDFFKGLYQQSWKYLAPLNRAIIDDLLVQLGIETPVSYSSDLGLEEAYVSWRQGRDDPTERILFLCRELGADHFLEGAAGKTYCNEPLLKDHGISLEYHEYVHPRYRQRFGPFTPYLSIVDLLFNHGQESLSILTHGGREQ